MGKVTYNGLTFEPYITNDTIIGRVEDIARQISADYRKIAP